MKAQIFNNAAQAWNHEFFWHSMKPKGGGKPQGDVASQIDQAFGSADKFHQQFAEAAQTQFGSGWAWLVLENNKLKVMKTPNAVNPLASHGVPLLACDVWEHAYYLDYQNKRPDFVKAFLEQLGQLGVRGAKSLAPPGHRRGLAVSGTIAILCC